MPSLVFFSYFLFLSLSLILSNLIIRNTARKTIFSFSRHPEKIVFPKKLRWNIIFLVLSGKMIFLFPEKMILRARRKMEDDLLLKDTRKYDIFYKPSENMAFPKGAAPAHDLSCIIWKDGIFFPENMIFFTPGRK